MGERKAFSGIKKIRSPYRKWSPGLLKKKVGEKKSEAGSREAGITKKVKGSLWTKALRKRQFPKKRSKRRGAGGQHREGLT